MYRYKNKTDRDVVLVGVGTVKPQQEFYSRQVIENANIEFLGEGKPPEDLSATDTATQPNEVNQAERVEQSADKTQKESN